MHFAYAWVRPILAVMTSSALQHSAAAAGLSALLYVPVGIITLMHHPPTAGALGYAAAAGVLSSAVPFLADLLALRRVPTQFFGVFMSVNPVLAALVGLAILDQSLGWAEWLAITTIVTANTVSVLATHRSPARVRRCVKDLAVG
jgi:inner membrane transporter RhtA